MIPSLDASSWMSGSLPHPSRYRFHHRYPIQNSRDHTVTDPHLQMGPDGSSGEDRRMFRFHCPDLYLRVLLSEHLANSGDRTARPDAGAESVDGQSACSRISGAVRSLCTAGFAGFSNCCGTNTLGSSSAIRRAVFSTPRCMLRYCRRHGSGSLRLHNASPVFSSPR